MEQSERIERGTNRLREAQRVAIESEQIGADILGNLARDRESISRSEGLKFFYVLHVGFSADLKIDLTNH